MKKLKKFVTKPHIFFRDALNNKLDERAVLSHQENLEKLENSLMNTSIPIDVVFTWVNDKDEKWQEKKEHYSKLANNCALYAKDEARFEEHNELFYSVKSVQKFLPWVRYIFIVTDNQIPHWLNNEDPQIKIVDHREIIEQDYLPTFNSHVIEAHLHKIPNLSEHFIYFNDDVFVAKPLQKRELAHQHCSLR